MSWANVAIAGAAVIGAGYGIYSGERAHRDARKGRRAPPEPTDMVEYDEEGNIISETTWNKELGRWENRTNPEPKKPELVAPNKNDMKYRVWVRNENLGINEDLGIDEDIYNEDLAKAEAAYNDKLVEWQKRHDAWQKDKDERDKDKQQREEIRRKMLSNLNETPEGRIAAYDEYAKTYSDAVHKDVDSRFDKAAQAGDEDMEARGMTGSRAYVDTVAELDANRKDSDVEIAQQAELAKETLAQTDKNYWLNTLGYIDSGGRADQALAMQKQQAGMQAALGGTANIMARYGVESNNALRKAEFGMQRANNYMNTASGLAFLYGYGKKNDWFGGGGSGNTGMKDR